MILHRAGPHRRPHPFVFDTVSPRAPPSRPVSCILLALEFVSARYHAHVLTLHAGGQAAGDLVVDGAHKPGQLLRGDALLALSPHQHHPFPEGHRAVPAYLHQELVHADVAHTRIPPPADQNIPPVRENAEESVSVSDGNKSHPRGTIGPPGERVADALSLIHISEPTRRTPISYAVFCLKKKK